LFKKVTENTIDFDLVCFVDDIDAAARVSSDLYFDVFRGLRKEGIGVPAPAPTPEASAPEPERTQPREDAAPRAAQEERDTVRRFRGKTRV
jgi:small-conductance mechanosensitive channel